MIRHDVIIASFNGGYVNTRFHALKLTLNFEVKVNSIIQLTMSKDRPIKRSRQQLLQVAGQQSLIDFCKRARDAKLDGNTDTPDSTIIGKQTIITTQIAS